MRSALPLVVTLLLASPSLQALELRTLETRYDAGRYHVRLTAWLDAAPESVEKVLTDYANYPRLDPRIRWGRVLGSEGEGTVTVETMFHACVGIFCRDVRRVERVEHRDGELVAVVRPRHSDMRHGRAETHWRIEGEGTYLEYSVEFEPGFWVPAFIARKVALRTMSEATVTLFSNIEKAARGH